MPIACFKFLVLLVVFVTFVVLVIEKALDAEVQGG